MIYIASVILIITSSLIINYAFDISESKKRNLVLIIGISVLWLLCVLKADTVGRDIAGYKRIYDLSATWPWFAFDRVYFEEGYVILMQLFSKTGFPFQVFNLIVYTIIYVPWFMFLKRYSLMPTLSMLIYICYQFWVFNMSGLRQGIAMSICLIAFIVLDKRSFKNVILFISLVLIATTFHRSAIIYLTALGVYLFKLNLQWFLGFIFLYIISVLLRHSVVSVVNMVAGVYQVEEEMTLGGSFIMLTGFTFFAIFTLLLENTKKQTLNYKIDIMTVEETSTYMMMVAIGLNLILNGSNMLRGASYASMFLTISLPAIIAKYNRKSRVILCFTVGAFLLILFYHDVLMANQLDILPYEFFWQRG